MEDYRHILVATDLAAGCERVAERAGGLSRQSGASLSFVHVVERIPIDPADDYLLAQDPTLEQELLRQSSERLQELARQVGFGEAQQWVVPGAVKAEIVRLAQEHGVDLIVVGSQSRHGLALLLGSTADAVLHGAPCDVLAVRVGN